MKAYRNIPLVTLFGIITISIYCLFTMVSWAFYPESFAPWTNYLSRLGNFDYSPFGAFFYNWGCILTGIILIPFFISMAIWWSEKRIQMYTLILGQIIGLASAIALVMIGIYSEDSGSPHMTASSTFFIINFVTLIVLSIGLILHNEFPKLVGVLGIGVSLSSLLLEFVVGGPITEWYTVFASLTYVGFLAFATYCFCKSKSNPTS
ncbi:MAG: DUF998 domain-containing protein [Candidatus Thorarchaeota archaeon]|nr:DUF998 domain-containing protein [Candidatus Thorarchaeota archaeon]